MLRCIEPYERRSSLRVFNMKMWFEATHHSHFHRKQPQYSLNPAGDAVSMPKTATNDKGGSVKVPNIGCISNWGAHSLLKRGLRRWGSTGSWVCLSTYSIRFIDLCTLQANFLRSSISTLVENLHLILKPRIKLNKYYALTYTTDSGKIYSITL